MYNAILSEHKYPIGPFEYMNNRSNFCAIIIYSLLDNFVFVLRQHDLKFFNCLHKIIWIQQCCHCSNFFVGVIILFIDKILSAHWQKVRAVVVIIWMYSQFLCPIAPATEDWFIDDILLYCYSSWCLLFPIWIFSLTNFILPSI